MDELMLDGNAAAGVLREIFAVEVTAAVGTCAACGASDAVGALRLYRSAGTVLRCPSCDAVLMTIVAAPGSTWIHLRGLRALELPAPEADA